MTNPSIAPTGTVLQDQYLVLCSPELWTGTVTVDIKAELGPAITDEKRKLITGGVVPVLDQQILTPFQTYGSAARRECAKVGTHFARSSLYMLPTRKASALRDQLEELKGKFEALRDTVLIPALPALYHSWDQQHPEWAAFFAERRPSPAAVKQRMRFVYGFIQGGAPTTSADLAESFTNLASSTFASLVDEIGQRARQILARSFLIDPKQIDMGFAATRPSVKQTAINSIRDLVEKVSDFADFDARANPMLRLLVRTLDAIPKTGLVAGPDLTLVVSALRQLMDIDRVLTDQLVVPPTIEQNSLWATSAPITLVPQSAQAVAA